MQRWLVGVAACLSLVGAASRARAQPAPDPPPSVDPSSPPVVEPPPSIDPPPPVTLPSPPKEGKPEDKPTLALVPVGYVEGYYAWNFNRPDNHVTNFRGFDNRHNSLSLTNAALGGEASWGRVSGRVVLQVGSTPSTYYLAEPNLPGTAAANGTSGDLWKYLQEAWVGYKAPLGRGLLVQAGLVASPIGYESFAVRENWNYSHSNEFFGLPYYHAGARATYPLTDELSLTASVFNGWNSVVDNNDEKSVEAHVGYKLPDRLEAQVLYFGGVERDQARVVAPGVDDARTGRYWRHHFDAWAEWTVTSFLSFAGQADVGWEPTRYGTARWFAGALYARGKIGSMLYVALRGERFWEHLARTEVSRDLDHPPIFWGGSEWVTSGTATLELRPVDHFATYLEYRHDESEAPIYFRGKIDGDGSAARPFVANSKYQNTLLLGVTAWL